MLLQSALGQSSRMLVASGWKSALRQVRWRSGGGSNVTAVPDGVHRIMSDNGQVARITLQDGKQNTLSFNTLKKMHSLLHDVEVSLPETRVAVIQAAGSVFSAGHDLNELLELEGFPKRHELFALCSEVMLLIEKLRVPVIAAVQGPAVAAGCQLAGEDSMLCRFHSKA